MHNILDYPLHESNTANLYKEKIYIPDYEEGNNNIYYFVREPGIKYEGTDCEEEYVNYVNFMEGRAKNIKVTSYCYGGMLLCDGAFSYDLNYDETVHIKLSDHYVKSIEAI